MQDKIHPKVNKVVFLDVMSNAEFITTSTLRSEEVKKIDGEDHFVIRVETSSASHPFYTGKRKNEVRNNQVAKFYEKAEKAKQLQESKNQPKAEKAEPVKKVAKAKKKA
jgi:large subunit ribosomal protein L31